MKVIAHILTVVVALALLVGVPVCANVNIPTLLSGNTDTISSASMPQDAPSGSYTIYLNRDKHTDAAVLDEWKTFFAGGDIGIIFEDLSCTALAGDAAGIEMATSLQSRLPENQMTLKTENPILALSKAQAGKFDVLVMSDEAASLYTASTLDDLPFVEVIHR